MSWEAHRIPTSRTWPRRGSSPMHGRLRYESRYLSWSGAEICRLGAWVSIILLCCSRLAFQEILRDQGVCNRLIYYAAYSYPKVYRQRWVKGSLAHLYSVNCQSECFNRKVDAECRQAWDLWRWEFCEEVFNQSYSSCCSIHQCSRLRPCILEGRRRGRCFPPLATALQTQCYIVYDLASWIHSTACIWI